jgi:hypothetical protein
MGTTKLTGKLKDMKFKFPEVMLYSTLFAILVSLCLTRNVMEG